METSEWVPVIGFEGLYEINALGIVHKVGGVILKTKVGKYNRVNLRKNGIQKSYSVHSLVAAAFIGPRPYGMIIRHIDGHKRNNKAENLAYGTHAENEADKLVHGVRYMGERHHKSVLTLSNVKEIIDSYKPYSKDYNTYALARKFGVSQKAIMLILQKKNWKETLAKHNKGDGE